MVSQYVEVGEPGTVATEFFVEIQYNNPDLELTGGSFLTMCLEKQQKLSDLLQRWTHMGDSDDVPGSWNECNPTYLLLQPFGSNPGDGRTLAFFHICMYLTFYPLIQIY